MFPHIYRCLGLPHLLILSRCFFPTHSCYGTPRLLVYCYPTPLPHSAVLLLTFGCFDCWRYPHDSPRLRLLRAHCGYARLHVVVTLPLTLLPPTGRYGTTTTRYLPTPHCPHPTHTVWLLLPDCCPYTHLVTVGLLRYLVRLPVTRDAEHGYRCLTGDSDSTFPGCRITDCWLVDGYTPHPGPHITLVLGRYAAYLPPITLL